MATLIKADGTTSKVKPKRGKQFSLEEMQGYVGGHIERVRTVDGRNMFVNEEGKLEGLPENPVASQLYGHPHDYICGDVLVTEPWEVS